MIAVKQGRADSALPWPQTLAGFVYAMIACLVVNDAIKAALIRWCIPSAIAA
jgi:hypothetical protein